jgi:hypothetical protein
MKVLSEFFLLLTIIFTTSLSTIFCIIGLSTPGWRLDTYQSLFCDQCPKSPPVLAIISMILLIICLILLGLLIAGFIDQQQVIFMRFIIPALLLISSIFLLSTLTSYLSFVDPNHGYSYKLTITAFIFAYFASLFGAFWFGSCGFISKTYSLEKLEENR